MNNQVTLAESLIEQQRSRCTCGDEILDASFPKNVWYGYNPDKHPAVLFDDVKDIFKLVVENKTAFQAIGDAHFGASATNCHIVTVDLLAKPLIICCNGQPSDDSWSGRNFHVVQVKETLVDYS